MTRYIAYYRGALLAGLAQRAQLLWELGGSVAALALYASLWRAVYGASARVGGMTLAQTLAYYALARALLPLVSSRADRVIGREISRGGILSRLMRPANALGQVLAQELGGKTLALAAQCAPLLLAAYWLGMTEALAPGPAAFAAFLVSLPAAVLISFALCYLCGLSACWLSASEGVLHLKDLIGMVATGALLPLSFYPAPVRAALEMLPFRFSLAFPISLLTEMDAYDARECALLLGCAYAWAVALLALCAYAQKRGFARMPIRGG